MQTRQENAVGAIAVTQNQVMPVKSLRERAHSSLSFHEINTRSGKAVKLPNSKISNVIVWD